MACRSFQDRCMAAHTLSSPMGRLAHPFPRRSATVQTASAMEAAELWDQPRAHLSAPKRLGSRQDLTAAGVCQGSCRVLSATKPSADCRQHPQDCTSSSKTSALHTLLMGLKPYLPAPGHKQQNCLYQHSPLGGSTPPAAIPAACCRSP